MKPSLVGLTVAFALVAVLHPGLAATCVAKSIAIEDFDTAIDLAADGTVEIVETIRLRFTGSWNGIRRSIPVVSTTPRGDAYRLRLAVRTITDAAGRPLTFERSRGGRDEELKIFVPQASDAVRTVALK